MRDDESHMPLILTQPKTMEHNSPQPMTKDQAREWMNDHWDADEIGTDLDSDILDDAFVAVFKRRPDDDEDAFGELKNHFLSH